MLPSVATSLTEVYAEDGMTLKQLMVLDSLMPDAPPFSQDDFATAKVDVSPGQVADALSTAVVDEGCNCGFQFRFEEVVFQQDSVFQDLVPTLNFAPGFVDASARRAHAACPCLGGIQPDRRRCKTTHCRL